MNDKSYVLWNNRLAKCRSLNDVGKISKEIGWGFYRNDIITLVKLHKENKHRIWIEELLTDCNFHTECAKMKSGNYEEILEVYS